MGVAATSGDKSTVLGVEHAAGVTVTTDLAGVEIEEVGEE